MMLASNDMMLYPLPDTWQWVSLCEIATIGSRQVMPFETPDQPFNYLALENIESGTGRIIDFTPTPGKKIKSNKFVFDREHVLYGKLRPYLRKVVTPGFEGISATDLLPIKPDRSRLNRHYLKWWLLSPIILDYVTGKQTGVKMPRLRSDDLNYLPVPLPPLAGQIEIVNKLDSIYAQTFTARGALDRIPALLKVFRQSVLASAFRGELTERDPNDEPAAALLARIRAERRRRWEESLRVKGKDTAKSVYEEPSEPDASTLPELPKGWVWTKIGIVTDVSLGGTPSRDKPEYWEGGIPWVSSGEVSFCHIDKTEETISQLGLSKSNAKYLPAGSVLLAMIGEGKTRGQAAILNISATTNQNIAALNCSTTAVKPEWIFYWFMLQYEEVRSGGLGGAQPALNAGRVKELVFPIAPEKEQTRIVYKIKQMFFQKNTAEVAIIAASRRLEELGQSALAKAFRGEL